MSDYLDTICTFDINMFFNITNTYFNLTKACYEI